MLWEQSCYHNNTGVYRVVFGFQRLRSLGYTCNIQPIININYICIIDVEISESAVIRLHASRLQLNSV
jgi:hypothetical protein